MIAAVEPVGGELTGRITGQRCSEGPGVSRSLSLCWLDEGTDLLQLGLSPGWEHSRTDRHPHSSSEGNREGQGKNAYKKKRKKSVDVFQTSF